MVRVLAFLAFALLAPSAMATVVTYSYTGTVTNAAGLFAAQGTVVRGTFSFDDGLVDEIGESEVDWFQNDFPVSNQALTASFNATLTLGSVSVTRAASNPLLPEAALVLYDTADYDQVDYEIVSGPTVFFYLVANDSTGTAISPGSGSLSGTTGGAVSVLNSLDLAAFDIRGGAWNEYDLSGTKVGDVYFTWAGIGPSTVVPIPAPIFLLLSGMVTLLVIRRPKEWVSGQPSGQKRPRPVRY
jgi:hypothetical protein